MERNELIDDITSNSEIKRESLEGMGDTCLQTTHQSIVGNSEEEDDDGDEQTTTADDGATLGDMTVDELGSALADQGFVTEGDLSEVVANAQQQLDKSERVNRIIANSAEYDEEAKEDLMATPDSVLDDIEAGISSNSALPGATGAAERATANAANGDSLDDYSDGTIGGDL